jgi:hypothetical protein
MAQDLKILSINFPFRTAGVIQEPTLATKRALFDFDVVVIRPYLLLELPAGGPYEVDRYGSFNRVNNEMTAKIDDLSRLLSQGGLLIVILDVQQELTFHTGRHSYTSGGTLYTTSNYHFLVPHFFECVRNGTGNNVEILRADPFSTVIKKSDVEWTAFIVSRPPDPFADPVHFARNGARSYVGGRVSLGEGNVVFLPNFRGLNEGLFIEACREYRYEREGTPAPEWCKNVSLPGLTEADDKIMGIDETLRKVEQARREAVSERDGLLAYKKLLYEKGKTQLEPTVRRALDQIGFKTTPSETLPGAGFEIDGRTTVGSPPGILEVKGSKKQIGLDEFSPFIPKILADLKATGHQSKGILVGNGLCESPPKDRLGEKVFSPHVLEAAKTQSIALINSVELYRVVCGILAGQIQSQHLELMREKILKTSGFVSLLEYCNGLPMGLEPPKAETCKN